MNLRVKAMLANVNSTLVDKIWWRESSDLPHDMRNQKANIMQDNSAFHPCPFVFPTPSFIHVDLISFWFFFSCPFLFFFFFFFFLISMPDLVLLSFEISSHLFHIF